MGTGVNGPAVLIGATSSLLTFNHPQTGVIEHFSGAFVIDGTGGLPSGTVANYDQVMNGQYVITATGLNLSAFSVSSLTLSGNSAQLMDLALAGNDQIWGGIYDDWIDGGPGGDTIIALDGADTVYGWTGNDDLNGNKGDDRVLGEDGADWVRGGQGNDSVAGGAGNDPHVNGNLGNDFVYGGDGNDTVYGGQGDDVVGGDAGDDLVYGDLGNDIVVGGKGTDLVFGGVGADAFFFEAGDGIDAIGDFSSAAGDRIYLRTGTTYTLTTVAAYSAPSPPPAGWGNYSLIDIHNATDVIVVIGVTPAQLGTWLVYY